MRIRILPALILFLGSYLPLSLILLVQDFNYKSLEDRICLQPFERQSNCYIPLLNPSFSLTILGVCLACFVSSLVVLQLTFGKREMVVGEVKYIPAELMNYTLPYVVSFMSISYQESGKFLGLVIFLLWIFWITYRSGQIILNPLLISFGWRLYEIKYRFSGNDQEYSARALGQGTLIPNQRLKFSTIQDVIIVNNAGALNDDASPE